MPVDPRQQISFWVFLGGLLLALVAGLVWALNPDEGPDPAMARPNAAQPTPSQAAAPSPNSSPVATPTPATMQAIPPEALIAAAPPPGSTTLQVLDAGGGRERQRVVASALQALGYRVISTSSARQDVSRTTIWFTHGNEATAQALRARDPRFADIAPNAGLSAQVDLHILVGPDWQ